MGITKKIKAEVIAVCTSEHKGERKKQTESVTLIENSGILGDAHAGAPVRQVSLLAQESVDKMRAKFPELKPGDFAENILTKGINLAGLPIGTKLHINGCILRVSQIGKECHQGCAIRKLTGDCVMPREGIFAVVEKGGVIRAYDEILEEKEV